MSTNGIGSSEGTSAQKGTEEDSEVVALLRTPGLSIKYLDPATKERIRLFIQRAHVERGMSLGDIAKLIGNKTSGYTSWLCRQLGVQPRAFEEARLKGIHEKVRKYERKPFDGTDEDRAYLLGLAHGDLSVSVPFGDAIRISTSSTKPAMIDLFSGLFSPFGHVYKHPREKKDMKNYEWNLSTIVDNSFSFLLQDFRQTRLWIEENDNRLFGYLSGFLDAEGSIITTRDRRGKVVLTVDYNNCDKGILEWIMTQVKRFGLKSSLRINKKAGEKSRPYGIPMNSDYWQLSISSVENIRELVSRLRPRHREKMERQAIAISTYRGQDYESIVDRIRQLRSRIRVERDRCVLEAEFAYKSTHTKPAFPNPVESGLVLKSDACNDSSVLCTTPYHAYLRSDVESVGRNILSEKGLFAAHHESFCLQDEPCVVLYKRCNPSNIIGILVHESIHHVLLWLECSSMEEVMQYDDRFDQICHAMVERGFEL